MPNCPRCDQSISSNAIACPHCGMTFKAYGHPGITLHRTMGEEYLCNSCTYHADDTCNFPQRSYAKECTLYQDMSQSQLDTGPIYTPRYSLVQSVKLWCQRNPAWLGILALATVSFLLAWMAI
ncbi:MAG: hypothetical protein F6K47_35000 [Symploca sp. SIO2E6]|nr:hypothetical protein [Symploca sp. SIO2E6]